MYRNRLCNNCCVGVRIVLRASHFSTALCLSHKLAETLRAGQNVVVGCLGRFRETDILPG